MKGTKPDNQILKKKVKLRISDNRKDDDASLPAGTETY